MFKQRVAYWLVLAACLLLVIGTFTYQRVSRRAHATGVARGEVAEQLGVSQAIVVASSALAMLSVLIAGLQMRAESRHRQQVELELQDALASVERQVAERTEALSRAMTELKASEQLKDEFLATASHELRTPLNAIVGWAHVLQSGAPMDETQRRHAVNAIDRNAKVQTRLIEELLDVSRMIQGRVSLTVAPLDARAVLDAAVQTIRPSATAKEVAVRIERPAAPVTVIGDAPRLQQVVWNLLSNAIKFTPKGGTVSVAVRAVGDHAEITVTDTGEGITPAFLPHLFEPFRQGALANMRAGMGLGLAIVQRLVDLHGGRVRAESGGVGQGAQFTVTLPLAPDAASAPFDFTSAPIPLTEQTTPVTR